MKKIIHPLVMNSNLSDIKIQSEPVYFECSLLPHKVIINRLYEARNEAQNYQIQITSWKQINLSAANGKLTMAKLACIQLSYQIQNLRVVREYRPSPHSSKYYGLLITSNLKVTRQQQARLQCAVTFLKSNQFS